MRRHIKDQDGPNQSVKLLTLDMIAKAEEKDSNFKRNELLLKSVLGYNRLSDVPKYPRLVWQGESQINGEPIGLFLSGLVKPSENGKISDGSESNHMIQAWILPLDSYEENGKEYFEAMSESVCGTCSHSSRENNTCYVRWREAPLSVWRYATNSRPLNLAVAVELVRGFGLRCGAAGDPAAVPMYVWNQLLDACEYWTGYTHLWNDERFQDYKSFCMASVDCIEEEQAASQLGWLFFRVGDPDTYMSTSEKYSGLGFETSALQCLATDARLNKSCATCKLCSGHDGKGRASIGVRAHGQQARRLPSAAFFRDQFLTAEKFKWVRSQLAL